MPRPRTGGWIIRDGKLYARVSYRDPHTGKAKFKERRAENKTAVPAICRELIEKLDKHGPEVLDGEKMRFAQLVERHTNHRWPKSCVEVLKAYFGDWFIRTITEDDIARFKEVRLNTPTRRGQPRTIRTVNHELQTLRGFLLYALDHEWIKRNPFKRPRSGKSLITPAEENRRDRLLTRDEEQRLLAQCVGSRAYLRPMIITAICTGLRRGVMLKLRWSQIDLVERIIRLPKSTNNKQHPGIIGITARLAAELTALQAARDYDPAGEVFCHQKVIHKAWGTACKLAGIVDLHWHDLRHRFATDAIRAGIPKALAMRATGHTQAETFDRYVNIDTEIALNIAAALDRGQSQPPPSEIDLNALPDGVLN